MTEPKIKFEQPVGPGGKPGKLCHDYVRDKRMSDLGQKFRAAKFEEKVELLFEHGIFNKGKFKSLSKRRQKKFIAGFGMHYHSVKEKLIHENHHEWWYSWKIPLILEWVEKTGAPFDKMMSGWVDSLLDTKQ
uniref:Uncharacterized protein n=1 Tax=Pantoea phage Survivor TaxID=3232176 RepID=A0AAU8L0I6_9CAUD